MKIPFKSNSVPPGAGVNAKITLRRRPKQPYQDVLEEPVSVRFQSSSFMVLKLSDPEPNQLQGVHCLTLV